MAAIVAPSMSFTFTNVPVPPSPLSTPPTPTPPSIDTVDNIVGDNIGMRLPFTKVHKKMQKKERLQQQKRSFRSHSDSNYQQCRHAVVDWVCQVGEACGLKNLTIHAAIAYIDSLLDITPIDKSRIQLAAMACILISAKMEEQDENVPRVYTITSLSGDAFSRELVLKMESWILNVFKWEVNIVTTINFLEYYLQVAFLPADLMKNLHLRNYDQAKTHICKTAEFFVALSEHHCYFREFLPSVVAASCISAARQMLRVQPVWTDALQLVTTHGMESIIDCVTSLLSYYRQTFPS